MATAQVSLNALLRKFGADRAAMDMEENRVRSQYGMTNEDLVRNQGLRSRGYAEQMADRGRAHSGAAVKGNIELQGTADRENQRAAMLTNDALANIARKRLEAQYAFDSARLGLR